MSGCTVFVFLSLMEYALVNIVMGDIADIEKKKSSGLTNLLLGVRAPGLGIAGSLKQQKSFQALQELTGSQDQQGHKADTEVDIILTHVGLLLLVHWDCQEGLPLIFSTQYKQG